jgi:hypothetical protein
LKILAASLILASISDLFGTFLPLIVSIFEMEANRVLLLLAFRISEYSPLPSAFTLILSKISKQLVKATEAIVRATV